jgi:hypothetical protein
MMSDMTTATAPFRNGHHVSNSIGSNVYEGRLGQLPPPTPIGSLEEAAERMYEDGFVQIPDLFTPAEVAGIREWMTKAGKPDAEYEHPGWCFDKQVMWDPEHDPRWLQLVARSPAYELVHLILGDRIFVPWAKMWITGKGRGGGIHLDHLEVALPEDVHRDPRVRLPIFTCTLHLYFDDMVEEIGPTIVIPGSHRAGRCPDHETTWNGIAPQMISVKAGGALLFRHDLWHGAAMNTSERRRYMIQVYYNRGHNGRGPGPRRFSPEVERLMTPRQRQVLTNAERVRE